MPALGLVAIFLGSAAAIWVSGLSPGSVVILALWVGGLALVSRARHELLWQAEATASEPGRSALSQGSPPRPLSRHTTAAVLGIFALASLVTLVAGVAIEESGDELANRLGLTGAIFGATILAASTALPELSTGLASVRLGDHRLAFSDIFGGNAVLAVLFLVADAIAGRPTLPSAQASDVWMAGLGIVLTGVYIAGLVVGPRRRIARLGVDSILALALYALGILGLTALG